MAWFIPIALAAIQAGTAIYQGIKGAKQKREARALQNQANAQEQANLSEAKRMAMTGLPQAEYQRAVSNIYRQQALSLSALRDRRSALGGVSAIQQNTNDALGNLAAEDAMARRSNELVALNQGNRLAGITGNRAAEMLASGQSLTGAAIQNVGKLASNAAMYYGMNGSGSSSFGNGLNVANSPSGGNGMNFDSSLWGRNGYRGLNNNNPYAKPF